MNFKLHDICQRNVLLPFQNYPLQAYSVSHKNAQSARAETWPWKMLSQLLLHIFKFKELDSFKSDII